MVPASLEDAEKTEPSRSSAEGASSCQTAKSSLRCCQSHVASYIVTVERGRILRVKEVAMPKLPPPPPREAHRRSALLCSSAWITWAPCLPEGITISTPSK